MNSFRWHFKSTETIPFLILVAFLLPNLAAGVVPPPTVAPANLSTAPPTTTPAASITPVRPLYLVGNLMDLAGVKGRFIAETEAIGFQVVPSDRYAEELILADEGRRARKGEYSISGWKAWAGLATALLPALVETYRSIKHP